jgi:hypothetical protein
VPENSETVGDEAAKLELGPRSRMVVFCRRSRAGPASCAPQHFPHRGRDNFRRGSHDCVLLTLTVLIVTFGAEVGWLCRC